VEIGVGESLVVEFELVESDLSFVNQANKRVTEPGQFIVTIGNLSDTFTFE
jgi:hypothetical protein